MQKKNKPIKKLRGFSFMEILLSLALMTLVLGSFSYIGVNQFNEGKERLARTNAFMIANKVVEFYQLNRRYPKNLQEVQGIPHNDPWGNRFKYDNPGKINGKKQGANYAFDVYAHITKSGKTVKKVGNWDEEHDPKK
ncbi:MAG: hypothetical protein AAF320_00335 [Myxococcota bacterium]